MCPPPFDILDPDPLVEQVRAGQSAQHSTARCEDVWESRDGQVACYREKARCGTDGRKWRVRFCSCRQARGEDFQAAKGSDANVLRQVYGRLYVPRVSMSATRCDSGC